jgi:hypothetical protein
MYALHHMRLPTGRSLQEEAEQEEQQIRMLQAAVEELALR